MNYRRADCVCNIGWTGADCGDDFDGCLDSHCASGHCRDMSPAEQKNTGRAFTCSMCQPGYDTDQCIDINECEIGGNGCAQRCVNTLGSFRCECNSGYRADGKTCVDIDECLEGTHTCMGLGQECVNSPVGSYRCDCREGYTKQSNDSCSPDTWCETNHTCEYGCMVLNSHKMCVCPSGKALSSDGKTCIEVNECTTPGLNHCSSPELCTDMPNGYTCGCPAGSKISSDLRTCEPCSAGYWGRDCANQCDCGPNVLSCDSISGCSACRHGWTGAPLCNQDVDECASGTAVCSQHSTCHNVDGAYTCICDVGFEKKDSSNTCSDVNECLIGRAMCAQECDNTNGGYKCSCKPGYELDGPYACKDINECEENVCSDLCTNKDGSYECSCKDGNILVGNSYCASEKRIIRFKLRLDMIWSSSLESSLSSYYVALKSILESQLRLAFVSVTTIWRTHVVSFRPGSVAFEVVTETSDDVTDTDRAAASGALLKYLIANNWKLNSTNSPQQVLDSPGIYLNNSQGEYPVPVTSPCSVHEYLNLCKNGGHCQYPEGTPKCKCTEEFTGEYCDVPTNHKSGNKNIGLIVGLSVALSLLALALIGCCVYICCIRAHRQNSAAYARRRYNYEETPSEYSADGGSMKTRLTPRWTSDYSSPAYHRYDNPGSNLQQNC